MLLFMFFTRGHTGPHTCNVSPFSVQTHEWVYLKSAQHHVFFFINYSKVMIKVGLRFGLGLVLVLICHIRTANQLSHVESIDYKT